LSVAPSPASGQEESYVSYANKLAAFERRGAQLARDINDVAVTSTYCDAAKRRADGVRLAELFVALSDLRRDWSAFKQGVMKFAATPAGVGAFGAEGRNPNDPNFWNMFDRDVVGHPEADLDALRARYRASKVADCSAPKTAAPPPPRPPTNPKADPLAGLTRPTVTEQSIPPIPGFFCSEDERWAWYRNVVRPLMSQNSDNSWALRAYRNKLDSRLDAAMAAKPVDKDAVAVLEKEIAWAMAEHARVDKIYYDQIAKLIGWLNTKEAVIDCTTHTTTGPTPPNAVDTTQPKQPKVDSVPPTRPKADTAQPKASEPRVGFVPGAGYLHHQFTVFGGYEWNDFPSFPQVAGGGAGITEFEGKGTTGGSYIGLGLGIGRWRFSACRHASVLRYSQVFSTLGGAGRAQVDGELFGTLYDFSLGREIQVWSNTYVEWLGGYTIAYDVLEFTSSSAGSPGATQDRTLLTGKLNLGLSLRHAFPHGVDVEAGMGLHASGRFSEDADYQRAFRVGLRYNLGF
jgi:hypothetical protein